jgi:hypothetical protein
MERSIQWLLIGARILIAVVFLLNGFAVITIAPTMPARAVTPGLQPVYWKPYPYALRRAHGSSFC